ncbi:MAG TPA: heavy metal translocating P-type ATPase [Candidatus Microsaccharimonas sp.]|nr:heavy metal translocating P-type ATPase [Candidatus Microsaccharimonas sp.]
MKRLWRGARRYWQLALGLLTAIIGLGLQLAGWHHATHWLLGSISLILCIPLIVGMWDDFRNGSYGIDILALTAIVASVLLHQQWAAIVIVIMLTGGEMLEDYAERRAHRELHALLERAPKQAHVLRGRKVVDVSASDIHVGDKILIKPGETVPVDALLIEGTSTFDESSLTGESLPVERQVDGTILSGSINLDAAVTAKAVHAAADSQYQQIVTLVENAAASQAPFVRLADRYSIPFTLVAYIIAGAAWYVGHSSLRFLEVIVVATPCPLLLAAPIALISGMSRASKQGIIVRTGSALEKLAEAKTFAFDKTGTLTHGQPEVSEVIALKPYSKNEILGMAASLEQGSAHILAQAIVRAANEKHFSYTKAKHTQEANGQGVKGMLHGKQILVGQQSFLEQHDIALSAKYKAKSTVAYVALGNELVGVIKFKDEPRAESKPMLNTLRNFGIKKFLMVTGDNEQTARSVAKQLGIDVIHAGATPAAKLHAVEGLQDRPVVFVGDGVNDAPVLTASDIGIALGARGSTAASESADVIIMPDDISYVARAVAIARRTFSIAKQSIIIGILLSLIMMGVFFTGKFPPLLGAVLQEVVDVFVIFNALRAHTAGKQEV